jgi:NADH-quinone oxidoreductase subunit N
MVSLTGVPPTVGFMAKLYIFGAAVNAGLWWLALAGVINSVISAYYYLRVIKVMYLSEAPSEERLVSGLPMRLALIATTAGVLLFGVYPGPLLEIARTAAEVLAPLS